MATNYIDPKDERLADAKAEGDSILKDYQNSMNKAISANKNTMNSALAEIGQMGKDGKWTKGSATAALVDAQNANTEFAIEKIEQQKQQAKKDYTKEQSGAYVDWQKQSGAYGVNAEQMAATGLQNTGYSESSQVSMYNQYQARVTAARESYLRIVQDFDNNITEARLQNNSNLAQIYLEALEKRLSIVTQFSMKNTDLLTTLAQQKAAIKQQNRQTYQDVYKQLVAEKQVQEQQKIAQQELQIKKDAQELAEDQFAWQKSQAAKAAAAGASHALRGSSAKSSAKKGASVAISSSKGASKSAVKGAKAATSKKSSSPTVDMNSVLSLGRGPLSAAKLNELISQGAVTEYVENGKLKYKNSVPMPRFKSSKG